MKHLSILTLFGLIFWGMALNVNAQSAPGGLATTPAVWYRADNATALSWADASGNALNLSTLGTITVNAGNAAHNFNSWTTGYSAANFYRYAPTTNPIFGAYNDGGVTAGLTYNADGYYYMPLTIFSAARPTTANNGLITGIDNENTNGAEPACGVALNGGVLNPRFLRYGNGFNFTVPQTVPLMQTSVFLCQPPPGGPTAGTGNLITGLNGTQTTSSVSARSSIAGPSLKIGYDGYSFGAFPGDIQEVVWYKSTLSATDINKVETYLALKYGTTLTHNYINNTNTLYDLAANAGYVSNIAGIASDTSNGGLNQAQSNSTNTGKQLLIGTTGLANTNAANSVTLTNGQYLVWGDNGQDKSPAVAIANIAGTNYRFASIWKIQNTNSVGTVRVAWPTGWIALKLVQSTDPTFASGNTVTNMTPNTQTIGGVAYNYCDVTFTNGQYFTFAVYIPSPGSIGTAPTVWYKAIDASSTSWPDVSGNNITLSGQGTPTVNTGNAAHNFNSWTTGYSTTNYYRYTPSTNPVFGAYNDGGTTAGLTYSSGFYYMPLTVFGAARPTSLLSGSITGIDNETNTAGEPGFGIKQNGTALNARSVRITNGYDVITTQNVPLAQTSVFLYQPAPGGPLAGTGNFTFGINGVQSTSSVSARSSVAGPSLKIGYDAYALGAFAGDIQEVIWYKSTLTTADINSVETYFALKYGTTLAHNYVKNSNVLYDFTTNSSYVSNIAGIGYDTANGGLDQRQSNSVNSGKQLLISTTGLNTTNTANSVALTNGQYLIWGDNGLAKGPGAYMPGVPGLNVRFRAIWKVQNTGNIGTVRVAWPGGSNNDLSLMQSSDATFDASDIITNMSSNIQVINGVVYNYADVTLTDGQYFTFAVYIPYAPGGVFNGITYWYRADKNAANSGDNTNVTSWTDDVSGTIVGQLGTNPYPLYHNGAANYFNFNPGLNFTNNTQVLGNMSVQTVADTAYDIFTLTKEGMTGGSIPRVFSTLVNNTDFAGNVHYWDGIGIGADGYMERANTASALYYYANPGNINFATNSPSIMYHTFTNNNVSKGLNGATNGTAAVSGPYSYQNGGHAFGSTQFASNGSDNAGFIGNLGETIIYGSGNLTSFERNKIDAYLAIKYGITLNTAESYLNSSGNVIWDKIADLAYYYNVAGIGRDSVSDLNQKQSRSQITNNTNDQVTIGMDNIYATNANNPTSVADLNFLIWGDNNNTQSLTAATTTFTYNGSSNNRRMNRVWKVRNIGMSQSVKIRFPVASVGTTTLTGEGPCAKYVIMFASDNAFTSDVTVTTLTVNGTNDDALHVFPAGVSYFTYAKVNEAAAGAVSLPTSAKHAPQYSACKTNGWNYFYVTGDSTNRLLGIKNLTNLQLNNFTSDISVTGADYENGSSKTKLMSRITTITDVPQLTYTGVSVRVYYNPTELLITQVAGAATNSWIKFEGDANAMIADIQADGIFGSGMATEIVPSSTGTEDGISYVQFDGITSFSSFSFVSSSQPIGIVLPIKFLSFNADKQGRSVLLQWATATESRSKSFSIERSADSKNWSSIGLVNSKAPNGESALKLDYNYTDLLPSLDGANYYRIKHLSLDGKYEYSPVRMVSFVNNNIKIYPNPASESISISGLQGNERICIYDAMGRKVRNVNADASLINISLDQLAASVYQIQIIDENGKTWSYKIVKNK